MNLRRKRMILMDGQWYGYLRTASGNPLTLQNAKRLRKLTIYGNAVQDGTPSPDAPVEVQLCGDRTGNLWDRAYSDVDANWVGNPGGYKYLNLKLKENTTYTLFVKQNNMHHGYSDYWDSYDNAVAFCVGENPDPNTCNGNTVFGNTTTNNPKQVYSFTTTEAPYYFKLFIRNYNDITVKQVFDELLPGIMLVEGSYTADTLPAYEPYGYKVSGRAEGLNLLDYTKATDRLGNPLTIIDDGVIWDKMIDYYFYIPCDIKAGTKICFSCKSDYPENEGNSIVAFSIRYTDGTYDYSGLGCFTPTKDVKTFCPRKNHSDDTSTVPIKITDIMLVAGDYTPQTMPPYEPYQPPQDFAVYLPEQIAKVGDVADEVVVDMESKTAELKKNILQYEHSDNWIIGANGRNDVTQRFYQDSSSYLVPNSRVISNVFAELNPSSVNIFNNDTERFNCSNNNYLQVRVNKSRLDTVDVSGFKSWLAAYEETMPLIIYGEALTPVTTDITSLQQWDAMPQVSGTVTLTLSAEVEPSGAEAVYYSKERGE